MPDYLTGVDRIGRVTDSPCKPTYEWALNLDTLTCPDLYLVCGLMPCGNCANIFPTLRAKLIVIGSEFANEQLFQFNFVSARISLQTSRALESPWCSRTSMGRGIRITGYI